MSIRSRHVLFAAVASGVATSLMTGGVCRGVDGTWNVNGNGNWSTATNWTSNPAVPNGIGDTARFLNVITAATTIGQDVVGLTVGGIEFNDNNSYTISGSPITLAVAAGNATVTVNTSNGAAADSILTDLVLNSTVQVTAPNPTAVQALTFSGVISGGNGLVKTGPGLLVLSGTAANTFTGDTVVNEGTLDMFKTTAATHSIGGNLIVGDDVGGANADIAITKNGAIPNTSSVTVNSSGQFQVAAADTIDDLTIKGGSVTIGGVSPFLQLLGNLTTVAHGNQASISGTGTFRFPVGSIVDVAQGAAANDLLISVPITQGGFVKQGSGRMTLAATNTFGTGFTISAGTVQMGNGGTTGTLGTGGVVNNGILAFDRSDTVTLEVFGMAPFLVMAMSALAPLTTRIFARI